MERPNKSLSFGPTNAKIMIIVDSPDIQDIKKGKLLSDSTGRLLDSMLGDAGISLYSCRVTSFSKVRMPKGSFQGLYENKSMTIPSDKLLEMRRALRQEVREISPNVIVPLGPESLKALVDQETLSLDKWRGSILSTPVGKVIPTLPPERIQKQYIYRTVCTLDLKRVKEESLSPEVSLPVRDLRVAPSLKEALAFLEHCRESEYLSFDIETIPRTNAKGFRETHIDCIGFATSESLAMCIPLCEPSGMPYWSLEEEVQIWNAISETLHSPKPKKIAQNGQYDILILDRFGIRVSNFWADTLNMAHTLHSEFPKNLDFLVSVYTRDPYYGYMISEGRDRWKYNAKDTALTYEIAFKLLEDLEEMGLKDFYFSHVHPLLPIYIGVQKKGVLLDENQRKKSKDEIEHGEGVPPEWVCSECETSYLTLKTLETSPEIKASCCFDSLLNRTSLNDLQEWLNESVGHPLNVNSPVQMKDFLYKQRKYAMRYNKEGNAGSDEEILQELYKKSKNPELKVILAIRAKKKLISTYLNVKTDEDGRVRSSYMVTGTETGRLAASKSVDGTGWNAQNVPAGPAKKMIVADPGYVFVGADSRQAEARALAYLSGDSGLIEAIESGKDIYLVAATKLFKKDYDMISPSERALAKTGVLSANYGVGPRAFGVHAGITEKEAKEFLRLYFDTFPMIKQYHRDIEWEVSKTRILENPFGRKRRFHDRISDKLYREAYAYKPQSGVVDMIHRATRHIYAALPQESMLVLQTHDSLDILCREDKIEEVKEILVYYMTMPWNINGRMVSIPAEVKIGRTWNDA